MSAPTNAEQILMLQTQVSIRLAELGYADSVAANRISRHFAEIAVLGRHFAEVSLPLFLNISPDHSRSLGQLVVALKCDLEELGDAVSDVGPDLRELLDFVS